MPRTMKPINWKRILILSVPILILMYIATYYGAQATKRATEEERASKQAERAYKNSPEYKEEQRLKDIEDQFSAWDGSHTLTVEALKKTLNDPDSFKHYETSYRDEGSTIVVRMEYGAANAFGGIVRKYIVSRFTTSGNFVEVIDKN